MSASPSSSAFPTGAKVFLSFVFGLGYVAQFAFILADASILRESGWPFAILIVALLWLPAAAAFVARRLSSDQSDLPRLQAPSIPAFLQAALSVPLVLAAVYGITTTLGLHEPQWHLLELRQALLENSAATLSAQGLEGIPSATLIAMLAFLSVVLGATLFAGLLLGNELGWRAYLGPRLLPGMPRRSGVLAGFLWGLWLLPAVFLWFRAAGRIDEFAAFTPRFLAVAVTFGFALSGLYRISRNVVLCAVCLGVLLAQLEAHWGYLFPEAVPPWTGPFGLVAAACWILVGLTPRLLCAFSLSPPPPPDPPPLEPARREFQ